MKTWLYEALIDCHQSMSEDVFGHYLGRGLSTQQVADLKVGEWVLPDRPAPDVNFIQKQGSLGQAVQGWLSLPVWTPSGRILGVEFRCWRDKKQVRKYFLPEANWTAAFVGMCPEALDKIWSGGDVWLVEGVFDLALGHIIPTRDVILGCGGAKLSTFQRDFLVRFMRPGAQVYLVFDEDKTGREQAAGHVDERTGRYIQGVQDKLERVGLRVLDCRYRGGKDPGEIWDDGGRVALLKAFNNIARRG